MYNYNEYLLLSAILLFALIASLTTAIDVNPQYTNAIKQQAHEGFTSSSKPLQYSTKKENGALDSYQSFMINNAGTDCKKVYGFDGLFCKPYVADNKIDPFEGTPGSLTCSGSGLTNSKGSLCLDQNQVGLLSTRGGNATGLSY